MRFKNKRSRRGASMIALVALIAFFVVLPLSLVGFEMGRYYLMITQLENIAGACALSGTGAIATIPSTASGGTALEQLYNGCAQEAVYCMQLNSIIGIPLQNVVESISNNTLAPYQAPPTPSVNHAAVSISFLEQNGTWHKDLKTSGAVKMAVTMSFTTSPIFSTPGLILSLMPTETATASSTGGLPQLDVFLCFDISGSMDDMTPVAYVLRYWDVTNGCVAYDFQANQGPGQTPTTLYQQTPGVLATGTAVNIVPPQNLDARSSSLYFNQQVRCAGPSEVGALPGGVTAGLVTSSLTYPNGTFTPGSGASWYNPYLSAGYPGFTDMVVMPSAGSASSAWSLPSNWKQLAVVAVEQSRGNLDNLVLLQASQGGPTALAKNVYKAQLTAAVGQTKAQYWASAAQAMTPFVPAVQAAQNFVSTMNLSTDARFGLSCFSADAGSSTQKVWPASGGGQTYIASGYTYGGQPASGSWFLPWVSLSDGTSSFTEAYSAMTPPSSSYVEGSATQVVPLTQTNLYNSLVAGSQDIIANGRSTAKKAVVVFTDGVPTPSIASNDNTTIINYAKATLKPKGIQVYTIGLATNSALIPQEKALLNDSDGLAAAGATGGTFYPTTSADALNSAFQAIARSLVLLRTATN